MIKGVHTMFYSSDAKGAREFFRDKLGMKAKDVGGGWLIFDIPVADLGFHPADETGKEGAPSGTAHISFFCDDIHKTVEEMKSKGVQFKGEVEDHGYGFVTQFVVPGDFEVQLYQPKYK
ncbi:MAG TPA: VOC family protein [Chitinophagaceae bacterium]|nr:VOC family protein [Chitinophagaceae bacterium]